MCLPSPIFSNFKKAIRLKKSKKSSKNNNLQELLTAPVGAPGVDHRNDAGIASNQAQTQNNSTEATIPAADPEGTNAPSPALHPAVQSSKPQAADILDPKQTSSPFITARTSLKTLLTFLSPVADSVPVPGLKAAIGVTMELIKLFEKIQSNKEALETLAIQCDLLKETLAISIAGKDIKRLPRDLVESIEKLADRLGKIFKNVVDKKSGTLAAIVKADQDTALLNEANTGITQLLQLFWLENHVAGRIALQDILNNLQQQDTFAASGFTEILGAMHSTTDNIKRHILGENIKRLHTAEGASFDAYQSSESNQRTACFEGTRAGLLSEIGRWIKGDGFQSSIYVLDGIAGIGKSTVAQTVAERAAKINILGASFFFSQYDDQRKTARLFFSTIAFQLARYDKIFADHIAQALEERHGDTQKDLRTQFTSLIIHPLKNLLSQTQFLPIIIVLDALDECEEKDAILLLNLLGEHIHSLPRLKVFLTTRPESHIRNVLDRYTALEHFHLQEIESHVVQEDIAQYLDFRLSAEQVRQALPTLRYDWQPAAEEKQKLVTMAGTLFIIASTAASFVLDTREQDPANQLSYLLEGNWDDIDPTAVMDRVYLQILLAAAPKRPNPKNDWYGRYQKVMGAIVTLQIPLPCQACAKLLAINASDIDAALAHLHSLVAPSSKDPTKADQTYHIHHKSFPDFITTQFRMERATSPSSQGEPVGHKFLIDLKDHHLQMGKLCLKAMSKIPGGWNVCHLPKENWYKNQSQYEHSSNIPLELAYACTYWAMHLEAGQCLDNEAIQMLEEWAFNNLLAWLEVLGFIDRVDVGYSSLVKVQQRVPNGNDALKAILQDGCRFIQQTSALLEMSPLHIYWSAVSLLPIQTTMYKKYTHERQGATKVVSGIVGVWNSILAVLSHSGMVVCVACSPDGCRLASGSSDSTVRLWDVHSGTHIATLKNHSDNVASVAFSPDGSRLATGSGDCTVRLWDAHLGTHIDTLEGHSDYVVSVVFSPDGSRLASGSGDSTVRLWDAHLGTHVATLDGHSDYITSITFSPDGSRLASGSGDKTVRLWDGHSGIYIATLEGHSDCVTSVAFLPDGSRLASGSVDSTVRLWDGHLGTHITTLEGHSDYITSVAFSPDGSRLASGSGDKTVRFWDGHSGTHIATLEGHSKNVTSATFSPDGSRLASGSDDSTVRLWNGHSGTHIATLEGHSDYITSVVFSPDESRLASGSGDSTVRLWDAHLDTYIAPLNSHSDYITSVAFSSDGSRLASGSGDSTVRLWDAHLGTHIATLEDYSGNFRCVAFSPDGSRLASGSGGSSIKLWDGHSGIHIATLEGHSDCVTSVAFLPDGSRLASGSSDSTVRLWDGHSGTHIATLEGHSAYVTYVAFSPDGSGRLASGSGDKTVRLWDGHSGTHIAILEGHSNHITSLAFSPDGSRLASVSRRTVRLWDGHSGTYIATLEGHSDYATSVVFSSDGSRLASVSSNSTVRLCNSYSGHQISVLNGKDHSIASVVMVQTQSNWAYILVQHIDPILYGFVAIGLGGTQLSPIPFFWFPPHIIPVTFTLDSSGSLLGVGCQGGQVLILDISNVVLL